MKADVLYVHVRRLRLDHAPSADLTHDAVVELLHAELASRMNHDGLQGNESHPPATPARTIADAVARNVSMQLAAMGVAARSTPPGPRDVRI